jgi:hypothetical protein
MSEVADASHANGIEVGSRWGMNGSVYEVVSVTADGLATCDWWYADDNRRRRSASIWSRDELTSGAFTRIAPVAAPEPVAEPVRVGSSDSEVNCVAPVVCTSYFYHRENGSLRRTEKPAPLQHDFSDRYCVRVVRDFSLVHGPVEHRTQLCKECGTRQDKAAAHVACTPNPNWRQERDEWHTVPSAPQPAPPRFQAPELRAADQWSCGLGRSQR